MKKLIALLLALVVAVSMAACVADTNDNTTTAPTTEPTTEPTDPEVTAMTYEEFLAAEIDAPVVIDTYVQAHQSWWDNKITLYCQDTKGAYFVYEATCTEEDAAKLIPGTPVRITGTKAEWSGEIEIVDATIEFRDVPEGYTSHATVLNNLAEETLLAKQNFMVRFEQMTVKSIEYKNDEPGDDIYITMTGRDGEEIDFCVERYLTDPDSNVYKFVGGLSEGDLVTVDAFLYWYEGPNPHIYNIEWAK